MPVRVKKAAADSSVEIDRAALGLSEGDTVQAAHITPLRIALLKNNLIPALQYTVNAVNTDS